MLDDLDRKILRILQKDSSLSLDELASRAGSTRSPVWNRIKKLKASGLIEREVALLNADKLGLSDIFLVAIKTDQHSKEWLAAFTETVMEMPEIQEVFRMAGEVDYFLKVRVGSAREFDEFYKRFIGRINLFNVTSSLVMECIKSTTELKV